jgi:hypothetical protein
MICFNRTDAKSDVEARSSYMYEGVSRCPALLFLREGLLKYRIGLIFRSSGYSG